MNQLSTLDVGVYLGDALARYHFGVDHPFGPLRYQAFVDEFMRRGLERKTRMFVPVMGTVEQVCLFHDEDYVRKVQVLSRIGHGFLDRGDTPALPGIFEAALVVVGTTLDAVDRIMRGEVRRAFTPIAGLHHARRNAAAGFCVLNDCGIAIEYLRRRYGVQRIAYVDIDAHHGDGVFYGFEDDVDLCFADIHEDGRYLYPGTGAATETGVGAAVGAKLNLPMSPGAGDADFVQAWERVEEFVRDAVPEFVLLQCGADSLGGDPITHLNFSAASHAHAARRLRHLTETLGHGRVLALGGGGYDLRNIGNAWCAVVEALAE